MTHDHCWHLACILPAIIVSGQVIDWFHRAAEELGDGDVATAVAKFPPYEGKVSAEEEESWRQQPAVLPATVEEKASL